MNRTKALLYWRLLRSPMSRHKYPWKILTWLFPNLTRAYAMLREAQQPANNLLWIAVTQRPPGENRVATDVDTLIANVDALLRERYVGLHMQQARYTIQVWQLGRLPNEDQVVNATSNAVEQSIDKRQLAAFYSLSGDIWHDWLIGQGSQALRNTLQQAVPTTATPITVITVIVPRSAMARLSMLAMTA